eukprot:CAMPEP_0114438450 /NCGR_PEP_ID=MMETSP0103-20121206/14615_1 /TAXON_ID=37642 ORGANISM="Paraphysomonas imperforata, Strain PA2" /NCGR_SAMPLE_ID=MMETSP0103 /ASSEMBLY_ACC=CAM_ASM_000201 /LENGTH=31 /DNA_ID= /DNA_START= /DNA_END= /DNA_ORIENTATION=
MARKCLTTSPMVRSTPLACLLAMLNTCRIPM